MAIVSARDEERALRAEVYHADGEPVHEGLTAIEAVTRAEIDVQIATAKRFPRSFERFLREAKSMVASDPDLAAQCTYYLPGRSGGRDSAPIEGPSVRLAEICAVCWRNLRIVGRITDDDGKQITAQGVAMDLEANVGYSVEVKRSVLTRSGARFGPDLIKTASNAAIAIATRNATFKVVPKAFVNMIEDEAKRVARGDVKSLPERRARVLEWFGSKGVKPERLFAALGVTGEADMTLDHLMRAQGMRTGIQDGQSTIEELFAETAPVQTAAAPAGASRTETVASKIRGQQTAKAEADRESGSEG